MLLIGSHVSYKAKEYLVGSVKETINNDANCLMIFTGPPQNYFRKEIEDNNVDEAIELMKSNNIELDNLIIHAPYLMNLCSDKLDNRIFAINFLKNEIIRSHKLKAKYLVLHPGNHLTQTKKEAINFIAQGINEVIQKTNSLNVCICLETMAGKGTEIGAKLNELKEIIDLIENKNRIGVCLDTCHLHESGYDISDINKFYKIVDKEIGNEYIKVIHLNDSKNEIGARKDRHENLGYGKIGFKTLSSWALSTLYENIPKILETPYYNEKSVYKQEIKILKENNWFNFKD